MINFDDVTKENIKKNIVQMMTNSRSTIQNINNWIL